MLKACLVCGDPVENGKHCKDHIPHRLRGVYSSPTFQRNRKALLRANPICAVEGCTERATVAHHVPSRQKLVANGVEDPDALHWLKPRCERHHNQETGTGR